MCMAAVTRISGVIAATVLAVAARCEPKKPSAAGGADTQITAKVLAELHACAPLQKVHYWWPAKPDWPVSTNDELAYEVVRLTGSYNLSDWWLDARTVERAVALCKRATQETGRPASIGLHYSVWARIWKKTEAPTDTGAMQQAELRRLAEKLRALDEGVRAANQRLGAAVRVSAILYDTEVFRPKPAGDARGRAWNTAIVAKYNRAYDAAKHVFPEAKVVWYSRGGVVRDASADGWSYSPERYFTGEERGDCWSISLYRIWEIDETRESFRRTVKWADEHGGGPVIPWVALGSGFRREAKTFSLFTLDYPYDPIYSWMLGREINHPWFAKYPAAFAPWQRAEFVVFYPAPFHPNVPGWGEHFLAYCRGAMLNTDVPGRAPWLRDESDVAGAAENP
jgi:hypothetical protein